MKHVKKVVSSSEIDCPFLVNDHTNEQVYGLIPELLLIEENFRNSYNSNKVKW